MAIAIVMVMAVGIVAGRWGGVRGRPGWISVVLLLAATLGWFVVEGVASVYSSNASTQFSRGEWTLLWRAVQWCLWIALVATSQIVLVTSARNRTD